VRRTKEAGRVASELSDRSMAVTAVSIPICKRREQSRTSSGRRDMELTVTDMDVISRESSHSSGENNQINGEKSHIPH